jgi:hypothetical protein
MLKQLVQGVTAFLLAISGGWLISEPAGAVQVPEKGTKNPGLPVEHKTKFDPEMIPGSSDKQAAFPLSNSRQLARTASGYWLLAFDVPGEGLFISFAAPDSIKGSQFSQPVLLVGRDDSRAVYKSAQPAGISLAVGDKALYLAWSDEQGVWLADVPLPDFGSSTSFDHSFRRTPPAEMIAPKGTLGDITTDAQGRVMLAYAFQGVFVATRSGNAWRHEKVADAGTEPTLELDKQGYVHMAYRLQTEAPFFGPGRVAMNSRVMYTARKAEGWQEPQLVAQGLSFFPSIAVAANQPVIAYQFEGQKRVEPQGGKYLEQREGGGASIGFTARVDGHWQTGFVSQAMEILVRDNSTADAFQGRLYPMVEEKRRPKIAVDRHDIPWVFWPDTTRRHTYFARWLGSRFSDEYEVRGGYYAPSEHMTVEKKMPSRASGLGFAYAAAGRLYFGTVPVPSASIDESRHFLFLDMLEASEVRGLDHELNQFTKYPGNPVLGPAKPGAWDDFGLNFPNVHYEGGKFKMDYAGHSSGGLAGHWDHGYAESEDGIHWTRPKLGLIEKNGNRDNNMVPWVPHFLDRKEPDPNKRYKGVLVSGHARWIADYSRRIAYSPDSIHWEFGQETVNLTSLLEGGGPSFRDDLDIPERRFKAVGRTISQGHRALGMMWSPDLIHWHGEEAILDVNDPYGQPAQQWRGRYVAGRILDPAGEKAGDQIYWGNVWIENGLYLSLYAPYQFNGGYQAAFAMSRDGFNYVRVKNGEFIIPRGPAGAWDSGSIAVGYGIGIPLRVGEKIRVYYGGNTTHHGTDPWRASAAVGMAELRPDGWAYLRPSLESPVSYVTTIPISVNIPQERKLLINSEVAQGGEIRVEVLNAITNTPLQGYAKQDCRPLSEDSIASQVSWRQRSILPKTGNKVRLRFYLTGPKTRLYSFWFEHIKLPRGGAPGPSSLKGLQPESSQGQSVRHAGEGGPG